MGNKYIDENVPRLKPYKKYIERAMKAAPTSKKGLKKFLKQEAERQMDKILRKNFRISLGQAKKAAKATKSAQAAIKAMMAERIRQARNRFRKWGQNKPKK